MGFEETVANI